MPELKNKKLILIQKALKIMAILILKKYNPRVIGVTGSVGKTSTKDAVFSVLAGKFRVRKSNKNYNNEIGLPLTVIGAKKSGKSLGEWIKIFLKGLVIIIFPVEYPEILVLEMGADRPGDIKYLAGFVQSEIGIVTNISSSHLEFFKDVERIAEEKSILIKNLEEKSLAVINADDKYLVKMKHDIKASIMTFGFSEAADMRATDVDFNYSNEGQEEIRGVSFKLNYKRTVIPVRLPYILAQHHIYSALAASVVGIRFGLNLIEISNALMNFSAPSGRMNLIDGIKNSFIIDDTYNSSPTSSIAALDVVDEIKSGRKIVVLGDMLELGKEEIKGHEEVAEKIFKIKADLFFALGKKMETTVTKLRALGYPSEKIFHFENHDQLGRKLQEEIRSRDLMLIKGSQGMRMEKVVEEIMAKPENAEIILCRQNSEWKDIPYIS